MPKCPSCSSEVTYLKCYTDCEQLYYFRAGCEYETRDVILSDDRSEYECPECSKVLFNNDETASNFLEGKEVTDDGRSQESL